MYHGHVYKTFICYRGGTESGLLGKSIYSDLLHYRPSDNEEDFMPFFAPVCIPKGDDFKEAIANVLEDVKCFIMIMDKGFFDACGNPDDIVFFEISSALKRADINFLPIMMNGYNISEDNSVTKFFSEKDAARLRHMNGVNYHGIYDFNTEIDIIPVLKSALLDKPALCGGNDVVPFKIEDFIVPKQKKIVNFGEYPISVVNDVTLIDKIATGIFSGETLLDKKTNWMVYNGTKYASLTENPFNKTTFDDGRVLSGGSRNYYKIEPIRWIVAFENNDYYVLLSERIIDAVRFNLNRHNHRTESNDSIPANSWEYSYIRRWLNNDFLYDSFTPEEIASIVTCEIDNSKESSYFNAYSMNNTRDKVFLPSHKEIYLTQHGCGKATDYAKAHGAYASTSASHMGHGDWWTRSQGNLATSIENVDRRGCVPAPPFCNYVDDTAAGVRPMLIKRK